MVKWLGPALLVLVAGFAISSFYLHQYVAAFSVALIACVFFALIATLYAEIRDMKKRGGLG
jgi:hypothetical protein